MPQTTLITGATGNVGAELIRQLASRDVTIRAAVRDARAADALPDGVDPVVFDFADPSTHAPSLLGVDRVFFMRPPHMSDASEFEPFVSAMKEAGVRQVVFLSLMGVERNPVVPHHAIEKLLRREQLPWTFLRPGFYMQNLSTTHLRDIRERDEVFVPAGNGKTSFIDVRDIAECAAVLLTTEGHVNRAYTITGREALTYGDVARLLSEATGRDIRYTKPGGRAFARHMAEQGFASDMITVMRGIYLVARLGMAGGITDDLPKLLGRPARTFAQFAHDNVEVFSAAG